MNALRTATLMLFICLAACGGDATVDALTALGGKITEKDGVVTGLAFKDCSKLGAAEFKLIGQLKQLKQLTMYGSCKGLNDETLPLLGELTALEDLGIDGVQLSDDGMKHFAPLKNLRNISFFHPAFGSKTFTGAGLLHLKELPKLEKLTFAGTTAGDAALEAVGQITQLKEFRTWHTAQTQAGNAHLLKIPDLRELYIGQRLPSYGKVSLPSFDDSTIATIVQLQSLERLTLTEARLSLAALSDLKKLSKLKTLKIMQVDISDEDVKKLGEVLGAGVKIDFKPMDAKEREELLVKKLKLDEKAK